MAAAIAIVGLVTAAPSFAGTANDGDGTMAASPTGVTVGSIGNTLTFTFSAQTGKDFPTGSVATVDVPSGWTQPTTTAGSPGYTTASAGSCTPGAISVSGAGPWTIQVPMACAAGTSFTITYGAGANATHITAPSAVGTSTFLTKTRSGPQGTLVNLKAGSPAVTVNPGSASRLVFTVSPPSTGTAGAALSTFKVSVGDAGGNTITSGTGSSDAISLTIATGPAGGTINSAPATYTNVVASAGVATFTGVLLNTAGSYTVTALDSSRTGITTATSNTITIAAAGASKLAFVQGPSNASAGVAMTPAITVQVQDQYGNATATNGVIVTLTPSAGIVDSGNTATTGATGLATFNAAIINAAAAGLTVTASATSLAPTGASGQFNVTVAVSNGAALTDTASDGTGSGVKTVSYHYCSGYAGSCTGANWTLIGSSSSATGNYLVNWSGQPANGQYRLVVVGTDNVTNVSLPSASIPVTINN